MLSFKNWIKKSTIKKKDKNGKQSNYKGSGTIGDSNNKRETYGFDQEIPEPIVHVFSEP
jgi:hypothetical protein